MKNRVFVSLLTKSIIRLKVILLFFLFVSSGTIQAQDSLWVRKYHFGYFNQYDLRNSSTNFMSMNRVLQDSFRKGITSKMNKKAGNITYGFFSFSTTFLTMLWSHEFGHSLRAQQVGGQFKIHNLALPVPYTTMHLPEEIRLEDEALSVTAGFEVNYLSVRDIQQDFIVQNGSYNEELSLSFAHRVLYPIYTSLIVPIDPEDPAVWLDPAGDPVHIALLVFQNYSNDQVFMPDGSVNPGLVRYYNQSAIFGSFFSLLDPQFYREVGGAFGKNKVRRPIFLIGDHENGWTYGTLFNVSPLGYELYLNNYIHFNGNKFSLYAKYGNPYKNYGVGIVWNDMISAKKLNISSKIEAWDQDLFNKGISGEITLESKLSTHIGASLTLGYKTEGYVLGKQLDEGFNLGVGLIYYAKY